MKTKTSSHLISTLLVLFMIGVTVSEDDKWVWGRSNDQPRADSRIGTAPSGDVSYVARPILRDSAGHRPNLLFQPANNPRLENKHYRDESIIRQRYEVNEDFLPNREPLLSQSANHASETFANRPGRPLSGAGPIYQPAPVLRPQRPIESVNAPSRRPIAGASEPEGAAIGILTGPVPSWQGPAPHRNGDPTNFEKCKCSFSFNCKSPGIKFGSCDEGKQYCCYNDFDNLNSAIKDVGGDRSEPVPSVLVGPGANRPGLRPGIYGQVPINNEFNNRQGFLNNNGFPREPPINQRPFDYGNKQFILPREF